MRAARELPDVADVAGGAGDRCAGRRARRVLVQAGARGRAVPGVAEGRVAVGHRRGDWRPGWVGHARPARAAAGARGVDELA